MTTFTHIGGRARVGYQHCGRDFNHYEPKAGKTHALNRSGYRSFRAVCGVAVHADSSDQFDQGGSNPVEVAIGSARRVTCKQCLARNPVAAERPKRVEWVVVFEQNGETVNYFASDRQQNAEEIAAVVRVKGDTFFQPVENVRVVERTRYIG